MSTYRERREARAERLRGWAEKRETKAEAGAARAAELAAVIPFGQPILAGHHSEKRDRNYRARIRATDERAHADAVKAEEMRRRAAEIERQAAAAIYGDDPDALERLAGKLAELEAERARWRAWNASCRAAKGPGDLSVLTDRDRASLASVAEYAPYQLGRYGEAPGYFLSNLAGTIGRTRKRIDQLTRERGTDDASGTD